MAELVDLMAARAATPVDDLPAAVVAVSRIPYGRPSEATALAVLSEWRGTCSTKHLLLRDLVRGTWPAVQVEVWHRVYTVTRELAAQRWGSVVADVVPADGLTDVHTYATVARGGAAACIVDVTFPVAAWDGAADLPLACGAGQDHPAGEDLLATKRVLVARYCDPRRREPFIAALAAVDHVTVPTDAPGRGRVPP